MKTAWIFALALLVGACGRAEDDHFCLSDTRSIGSAPINLTNTEFRYAMRLTVDAPNQTKFIAVEYPHTIQLSLDEKFPKQVNCEFHCDFRGPYKARGNIKGRIILCSDPNYNVVELENLNIFNVSEFTKADLPR